MALQAHSLLGNHQNQEYLGMFLSCSLFPLLRIEYKTGGFNSNSSAKNINGQKKMKASNKEEVTTMTICGL
jgi:uncharacterized membrane-anchored protein